MSNEKNNQNLMVGAAVVAGLLGTLSALVRSNRTVKGWTEQAKNTASHMLEKGEMINKNMLIGGVTGGIIGAATALLLAPKSGSELMKDIAYSVSHPGEMRRSTSRKSVSRSASKKSVAGKKRASSRGSVAKRKGMGKTGESKTHHHASPTAKKSAPRRRTATAARKQSPTTAPEKIASEVTGS